jgi:putative membrane protein
MRMSEVHQTDRRTHGKTRNLLANERTFLAWMRTAVALMAFGFVLAKFDLFLAISVLHGRTSHRTGAHNVFGLALVGVGVVTLAAAAAHFARVRQDILQDRTRQVAEHRLPFLIAGLLLAMGIALGIYLWTAPGAGF